MTAYSLLSVSMAVNKESGLNEATSEAVGYYLKYLLYPGLEGTLDAWMEGEKPNFEIDGLSIYGIMQNKMCDYPTALMLLSIYAQDSANSAPVFFNEYDHLR